MGDTTWGFNYNGTPCDSFYNIYRNPLFADFPTDLHLTMESQCINAGNPDTSGLYLPPFDIDGNPRVYGSIIDLGVYEYISPTSIYEDDRTNPETFQLYQNYPNPFNPSTTISFFMLKAAQVNLIIFDITGRRVKKLVNEQLPQGLHNITWDGKNDFGNSVACGLYFYQARIGNITKSKKMLLLK